MIKIGSQQLIKEKTMIDERAIPENQDKRKVIVIPPKNENRRRELLPPPPPPAPKREPGI